MKRNIVGAILCSLIGVGCATSNQTISTQETNPTNGVVTLNTTRSRVGTVFQSAQVIEKIRASNGKTQSIGVSGIDQKSDAAAFAEAFGNLATQLGNAYSTALTGTKSQVTAKATDTTLAVIPNTVAIPADFQKAYDAMTAQQKAAFIKVLETCPDGSCLRVK